MIDFTPYLQAKEALAAVRFAEWLRDELPTNAEVQADCQAILTLAGSDAKSLERRVKKLKDELVMANIRLVRSTAQKVLGKKTGPDLDEAEQDGVIGLMHAIEVYDPERGPWAACAVLWIRYHVQTCVHHQSDFPRQRHQRMPPEIVNQANKIRAVHGREPQPEELSLRGERVTEAQWRGWNTRTKVISVSAMANQQTDDANDHSTNELIADADSSPEQLLAQHGLRERLDALLSGMSPRNREILRQVCIEGREWHAVAEDFGLCRQSIGKIRKQLVERLRKAMAA